MAKNLVIVESPAKCRTISKYLGKDFTVKATMGHIIDLPERELGVDIANGFIPRYIVSKGKKKVVAEIREEAAKAENIFLAPDPDREGEAIAWHVATEIGESSAIVKRVQFNEITKKAVLAAIASPHELDMNKVNAQQARRILDRIVGYQISPILWRTVFKGLSAGRVQSVALRIICEREEEIKAFTQEEYWSVLASLEKNGQTFSAKLHRVGDAKPELKNEADAKKVVDAARAGSFAVSEVVKTEKNRKPYAPFITSTLQQEAARKLGFSAARTMLVAQQLYEGLELGELGTMGLITYMRTDSTRISDDALADARNLIATEFSGAYLPEKPNVYGKSKNAQDAHEAIRPSQVSMEFSPERVKNYLVKDQYRLYELIWKRFLASQMANAVFDSTRLDLTVADYLFRATGSIMKFDGFLVLYDETTEEKSDDEGDNSRLPLLTKGDMCDARDITGHQHFTQPPPRYTEASLVKVLEEKGIGRPSTYAQIIDTLKKRHYVELESRRFIPTEVGYMVKNILVQEFPAIFEVNFTADMEKTLDRIEEGNADWVQVLKDFYAPFELRLDDVKKGIKEIRQQNQEVTDRTCPECNENMLVIKWSRNGRFLACQGFPTCKYTEPLNKTEPETTEEICDKCGAPMVVLNVRGNRFLGCSKYPDCKNTKSIPTGVPCPQDGCSGQLSERVTKKGKTFFGCSAYPKCTYASWDRPVKEPCPACGFPAMLQKESRRGGGKKYCPKCKHEIAAKEAE